MTPAFSIEQALAAPFNLVRRQPLAVLVWGLLILLPSAASIALSFAMIGEVALMDQGGGDPELILLPKMMQFQAGSLLLSLVQVIASVLVATAVIRATLTMGRREAFFFLRLGMDELRYVVVAIAIFGGLYVGMIVLMLVGGTAGLALWSIGAPGNWIAAVVIGLVCLVVVTALLLRVSLILPATILYRDFAFAQGWRLARGQVPRLLGLFLLMALISLALWAVLMVLVVIGLLLAGGFDWAALSRIHTDEAWTPGPVAWPVVLPWAVVATLPAAFLCGFWAVLGSAPFASAVRQLADGAPVADMTPSIPTAETPGDTL